LQFKFKEKGDPWTFAKCFDTATVLSEIVLKNEYKIKGNEKILLKVNDELKQNSSIDNMIFSPVQIVKFISTRLKLEKGDLIFTGTPEGVSKVVPGDFIYGEIENIAKIETKIIS
jgi:2-keto-4-pentenoate hydratase/2-oxohepta-3-ene-1,7-dioic acid hydratase in catechol pathway